MASACNVLAYEGYGNPYTHWLCKDGVPSPSYYPYANNPLFANAGDAYTFDDATTPYWIFCRAGVTYQEIHVGAMYQWDKDVITWCMERLSQGHPIALIALSMSTGNGGFANRSPMMGHAITLWEIDPNLQMIKLWISSSSPLPTKV